MPLLVEAGPADEPAIYNERDECEENILPSRKRRKVDGYNFPCPYKNCEKSYNRSCRLEEHLNTHTGERPFECGECGKTYMKSNHLTAHKQSHSKTKKYKCSFPDCNHSSNTRQHLKVHETLHTRPDPYHCTDFPPCSESFRKKHLLRAHIAEVHTHAPAFLCPYSEEGCQAGFTIQSKLKYHIEKRHSKRYFCEECPESFPLLVDLQRHTRDEHKPCCFTCDLEFSTKDALVKHLQIHRTSLDERKKYACQYDGCTKRYTKAFALKNHIRTVHEHVKPFLCGFDGCGRTFGFKKVLQRHELTHTQPAPPRERKKGGMKLSLIDEIAGTGYENIGRDIKCTVADCEWRFTREYDLKRHLASVHLQGNHDRSENDIENDPSVTE